MANIGSFKKSGQEFQGEIVTLSLQTARHLTAFARYAVDRGDTHVRRETAIAWAAAVSSTPRSHQRWLQEIALFARFLYAEDREHEVLHHHPNLGPATRPAPYIYTPEELARMLDAAGNLRRQKSPHHRGRNHPGMVGEIISERRATSNRNGGRDHSGMVGDIERKSARISVDAAEPP